MIEILQQAIAFALIAFFLVPVAAGIGMILLFAGTAVFRAITAWRENR